MSRPNVVMIVADDMGFSDLGCYGGEVSTPNLDALSGRGVRFTQHYSAGRCWPSRASIMTGQYYQQVPQHPPEGPLPDWGRTLPHYLKPAGYRCYHSGKWHVNQVPGITTNGGFHRSYHIRDYNRNFAVQDHRLDDRSLPPARKEDGYYSSTAIADHAIDFLSEHANTAADSPFLLYLAFIAPHFPLHAPQEDIDAYRGRYDEGWDAIRAERHARQREIGLLDCALSKRQPNVKPKWNRSPEELEERIGPGEAARALAWRNLTPEQRRFQARKMEVHAAMVHRMDREIGRVLAQIEAMGQREDTVVLFVSDNGASAEQIIRGDGHDKSAPLGSEETYLCLGPGWSTASNTPFRYHKSWVHEGGVASPLIVNWPAGLKANGEWRRTPCHFVDILTTVLDLCEADPRPDWRSPDSPPLAGTSLAPALQEDIDIGRGPMFFRHIGHRALRTGRWKLIAVHHGRWELYDMDADRSETRNLASEQPQRVAEMAEMWKQLHEQFVAQAGEVRD